MKDEKIVSEIIQTPLGEMLACVSDNTLMLFEFTDRKKYENQINNLKKYTDSEIVRGHNPLSKQLKAEINEYFSGKRKIFDLSLLTVGTEFQKSVWDALLKIPYGETVSYSDIARTIGKPKAVRAVANAIGTNRIAIIIPCHRVIGADGTLTGYAGGLDKKKLLLEIENVFLY